MAEFHKHLHNHPYSSNPIKTVKRYINCNKAQMESLYQDSFWGKVMIEHKFFRLSDDFSKSEWDTLTTPKDNFDSFWEILMNNKDVDIETNSSYFDTCCNDPNDRLRNCLDITFIEDGIDYVSDFSKNGVLASIDSQITEVALTRNWNSITSENEKGCWSSLLQPYRDEKSPPSNGLIIIDRYLFACNPKNPKKGHNYKDDYKNSLSNILEILKILLPDCFEGDSYHILFVFDDETDNPEYGTPIEEIVRQIDQSINSQKIRDYDILTEFLSVRSRSGYRSTLYNRIHDRKIISNYYSLKVTHGFNAFKMNSIAKWDQDIFFSSLFHGINNPDQNKAALPYKSIDAILGAIAVFIEQSGEYQNDYLFFKRGKKANIKTLENRLIIVTQK